MTFNPNNIFYYLCFAAITGLLVVDFTPIPLSVSMGLLFLTSVINSKPKNLFQSLWVQKPYLLIIGCFLILLPSYFYSDNKSYLFERWQIALPFLLLPIAFANASKFSIKQYLSLNLWLYFQIVVMAIIALVYYFLNQEAVNQLYLESRVMPTLLTHHPTLSLLIAFCIYCGYHIIKNNDLNLSNSVKTFIGVCNFFLFVFIHIYSVRIGLIALYLIIFIEMIRLVFYSKNYKLAIVGSGILVIIAAVTLSLSPTVKNKITNTKTDLEVVNQNKNANHHSMAMRLISYKNALEIGNKNPLFGCGLGDLQDENNAIYAQKYPEMTKRIIPHNLYLFFYASIGIIGLLVFVTCLFYGFLFNFKSNHILLNLHYLLIGLFFAVEAATQTQLTAAFVILPLLVGLNVKKQAKL